MSDQYFPMAMNSKDNSSTLKQKNRGEIKETRSLLDNLLTESHHYKNGKDYKELLNFVSQFRDFAPFNAMLLQLQKPGISYATTAWDWRNRFRRKPKEGARPLLILWPFGPVMPVYDLLDTEGKDLPKDMWYFRAIGLMSEDRIGYFENLLWRKNIHIYWIDEGDKKGGSIRVTQLPKNDKDSTRYRIHINRNHSSAVQFATLAHELGHLFLGHLGEDKKLHIPDRRGLSHPQREIEAESVAFIVCKRNGIQPNSERYLSNFVKLEISSEDIEIYPIMRAAGQVETILRLTAHPKLFSKENDSSMQASLFSDKAV